jgi:hypothetical protein
MSGTGRLSKKAKNLAVSVTHAASVFAMLRAFGDGRPHFAVRLNYCHVVQFSVPRP